MDNHPFNRTWLVARVAIFTSFDKIRDVFRFAQTSFQFCEVLAHYGYGADIFTKLLTDTRKYDVQDQWRQATRILENQAHINRDMIMALATTMAKLNGARDPIVFDDHDEGEDEDELNADEDELNALG